MRTSISTSWQASFLAVLFAVPAACGDSMAAESSELRRGGKGPGALNVERILDQYNSTDVEKQLGLLHSYEELVAELEQIAGISRGRVTVGRLVDGEGNGLLPTDEKLMTDIIGTVPSPALRNTIQGFGLSTQGRAIMAARAGTLGGRKVMVIAQQHGNEVTSTEAMLRYLYRLALSNDPATARVLALTDMLFIVRSNPDGGEPDPEKCLMADAIPFWGTPFADGSIDCALHRLNVDPRAGYGSLIPLADPPSGTLFGGPFLGYDTNRYHYALLDGPIYPVETQALVYAMKAFAPEFMLDLHNQNIKSRCPYQNDEEYAKCVSGEAGERVDGTIQAGPIVVAPTNPSLQTRAERLAAHLLTKLNRTGSRFTRFAQVSESLQAASRTSVDAGMQLGIVSHWLEVRCNSEVVGHATIEAGARGLEVALGMPSMEIGLPALHEIGIHEYLLGVADGVGDGTTDDGGFKSNPAWDPPNFDLFITSDQLSAILVKVGAATEPVTPDKRINIRLIE